MQFPTIYYANMKLTPRAALCATGSLEVGIDPAPRSSPGESRAFIHHQRTMACGEVWARV